MDNKFSSFSILLCVNWKGFAQCQDFLSLRAVLEKYFTYKASTYCFMLKGVDRLISTDISSLCRGETEVALFPLGANVQLISWKISDYSLSVVRCYFLYESNFACFAF